MFIKFPYNEYFQFIIASIIQFYGGYEFYKSSFMSLKNRLADMNLLVFLGTFSAYFYSILVLLFPSFFPENTRHVYFEGSSAIITFVLLGRYLEQKSKLKATDFMKNLLSLKPTYATIIVDGKEYQVKAENIVKGDIIIVRPGDKIPVDGIIIEGQTEVEQSFLTGESNLVYKKEGDEVLGGSINKVGVIKIKATKNAKDSVLNQIINLLLEAQSKKPKIGQLADRISQVFVPSVLIFAIIVINIWYYLGYPLNFAFTTALAVLVIACPCALGLATPIAIVNIVGRAAKEGILIKNPEVIENLKDIGIVIFDKTGTLTEGKFQVVDTLYKGSKEELEMILSLEKDINHPISQSIVSFMKENGFNFVNIFQKQILAGRGITGIFDNKNLYVGNKKLFEEIGINISDEFLEFLKKNEENGYTVIFGAVDDRIVLALAVSDSIKKEAFEVLKWFKNKGVKTVLLTGDNEKVAKNVAKTLGIDEVYWQLTPIDKYKFIKNLKSDYEKSIVFVGDGINDAPAMAECDVGIAVESASDITKDAGDIILLNSNLKGVIKAVVLAEKGLKITKQNLFWAYVYNLIGIPVAAGFLYPIFGTLLNPMYAGMAMAFSSITVVLNALRLRRISLE
ncbi:copper-translocating P-type ATPase [Sulfurihydrogenibium yellowstonense]|uniref:Copper-translocating P-type ATPase n=1 Tax=Sulfurihydrogenibium yellowstonense SS-5 TaxID=432331 RepID=C4FK53_9AQUI|nr:copper-translocating P-type ATPase [Sulfurihydrogenibium yellowstonense]EEP60543.1 copper-translocating P-type ATPase [Sulfurihydrogenibium yellowstonense SS-5]